MMPRPLLTSAFNLTYRKIPILAINKDIYCDTSLQLEVLNSHPLLPKPSDQHPSLNPPMNSGAPTRTLTRLLGSHYTDRPWFRVLCGLMPTAVWRSSFGRDRAGLIGHKLDPDKLEAKIPRMLAELERELSILEPLFADLERDGEKWMLRTPEPGAADINLYFMFKWGRDTARGRGLANLTAGEVEDLLPELEGIEKLFTEERFPGTWRWYHHVEEHWAGLKDVEVKTVEDGDAAGAAEVLQRLNDGGESGTEIPVLATLQPWNKDLDARGGLMIGMEVSIAPDDTGRGDPVRGTLVKCSAEELVITPIELEGEKGTRVNAVRVHFPRVGFVVRPLGGSRI